MKNIFILKDSQLKLKSKKLVFTVFSKYILCGFVVLLLSFSILSCKRKNDSQTGDGGATPQVEQGQGKDAAVSCKCGKGEETPVSLSAESVQKAEETCIAKGEGYQIKSCEKVASK